MFCVGNLYVWRLINIIFWYRKLWKHCHMRGLSYYLIECSEFACSFNQMTDFTHSFKKKQFIRDVSVLHISLTFNGAGCLAVRSGESTRCAARPSVVSLHVGLRWTAKAYESSRLGAKLETLRSWFMREMTTVPNCIKIFRCWRC